MISIIIIVKNDFRIKNLLRRLKKISKPEKIEIIVVDASDGKLDKIKEEFRNVKWIYYLNKKKKRITIPEQRNLGVQNARGKFICFIDADCIPKKDWLTKLTNPLYEEGEKYVTGKVVSNNRKSIHDRYWEKLSAIKYRNEAGTANSIIKREVFKKVGPFDEKLEAGEDIDFSWRAIKKGYRIRYIKEAIIYDDWGNIKQEIKRALGYGKARSRLYRKHKKSIGWIVKNDTNYIAYPLMILSIPLSLIITKLLLILVLLVIPLVLNLKNQPIKTVFLNLVQSIGTIKGWLE